MNFWLEVCSLRAYPKTSTHHKSPYMHSNSRFCILPRPQISQIISVGYGATYIFSFGPVVEGSSKRVDMGLKFVVRRMDVDFRTDRWGYLSWGRPTMI